MGDHLCLDQATGTMAVWTGATDLGPVFNPESHPTRVRFSSIQENIGFYKTTRTGSVAGSAWPKDDPPSKKITLFAHGLGYRPFLLGYFVYGGRNLPIQGSLLIKFSNQYFFSYTIGADATNVYMNIMRSIAVNFSSTPTVGYAINLCGYGVTSGGGLRRPPYFNGVDINAGAASPYVKAGYFDTATFRYPYRVSSGGIPIPNKRTMSAGVGCTGSGGTGPMALGFRYSVAGHVAQRNATRGTDLLIATGNDASFNAAVTRLAI